MSEFEEKAELDDNDNQRLSDFDQIIEQKINKIQNICNNCKNNIDPNNKE